MIFYQYYYNPMWVKIQFNYFEYYFNNNFVTIEYLSFYILGLFVIIIATIFILLNYCYFKVI